MCSRGVAPGRRSPKFQSLRNGNNVSLCSTLVHCLFGRSRIVFGCQIAWPGKAVRVHTLTLVLSQRERRERKKTRPSTLWGVWAGICLKRAEKPGLGKMSRFLGAAAEGG